MDDHEALTRWRRRRSVLLALMAVLFFGSQAIWSCNRELPAGAVAAGRVAADGVSYYGKKTAVYGYVATPPLHGAFTISDAVGGTAALPVIVKGSNLALHVGEKMVAEGTPTAFDAARLKQDYALDLGAVETRAWENRPVLVAEKVRKLD